MNSLFCVYPNKSDHLNGKLLSGGETSDICVMDFDNSGFKKRVTANLKENILDTKPQGFRHVLEPLKDSIQRTRSKDCFLRRGPKFTELIRICRKEKSNLMKSIFSVEHSKPLSAVDFCGETSRIAYYSNLDHELCIVDILSGVKIFQKESLLISQIKFSRNHLIYFDCQSNSLVYLKKHENFKEDPQRQVKFPKKMFVDDLEFDMQERYLLMNDNLQRLSYVFSQQSQKIIDLSEIWVKNDVLKLVQIHPINSEVYYIDNSNQVFYYSLKKKMTFKVDLGSQRIPHNLQIYSIVFSLFQPKSLFLTSDYDVVKVDTLNKKIAIYKKPTRIMNIISVVDTKSI